MTAVVNETLRVRPVVPIVARMLEEELRGGAHRLPKGTRVVPSIYLTNRNPRVYEQPEEFRPERFLERTGDVLVDPVRRGDTPVHRRVVRAARDEADPADGAERARAEHARACAQMAQRRVEPATGDHAGAGRGRPRGLEAQERCGTMMRAAWGRPGVRSRWASSAAAPQAGDPGRGCE